MIHHLITLIPTLFMDTFDGAKNGCRVGMMDWNYFAYLIGHSKCSFNFCLVKIHQGHCTYDTYFLLCKSINTFIWYFLIVLFLPSSTPHFTKANFYFNPKATCENIFQNWSKKYLFNAALCFPLKIFAQMLLDSIFNSIFSFDVKAKQLL